MDIDAALERLRQLAADDPDSEFAIAFEALDGWLSRGGFFPQAWQQDRKTCSCGEAWAGEPGHDPL